MASPADPDPIRQDLSRLVGIRNDRMRFVSQIGSANLPHGHPLWAHVLVDKPEANIWNGVGMTFAIQEGTPTLESIMDLLYTIVFRSTDVYRGSIGYVDRSGNRRDGKRRSSEDKREPTLLPVYSQLSIASETGEWAKQRLHVTSEIEKETEALQPAQKADLIAELVALRQKMRSAKENKMKVQQEGNVAHTPAQITLSNTSQQSSTPTNPGGPLGSVHEPDVARLRQMNSELRQAHQADVLSISGLKHQVSEVKKRNDELANSGQLIATVEKLNRDHESDTQALSQLEAQLSEVRTQNQRLAETNSQLEAQRKAAIADLARTSDNNRRAAEAERHTTVFTNMEPWSHQMLWYSGIAVVALALMSWVRRKAQRQRPRPP